MSLKENEGVQHLFTDWIVEGLCCSEVGEQSSEVGGQSF